MYEKERSGWPSFGIFRYNGEYLRIHHGQSNKQYMDLPSDAIRNLLINLDSIEQSSSGRVDFKRRALEEVKEWNTKLANELEMPVKMIVASLDKYYWGQADSDGKLGLRITVNWKKFSLFLEERSKDRKDIWKTFGYIYTCRNLFTQLSIEENKQNFEKIMKRYVKNVKSKSEIYINTIVDSLEILEKTTSNAISKIYNSVTRKSKRDEKDPAYLLYTLIYLNELRLKCNTLRSLTQIGDFPACFSEMRRIIEGLTTHMFWDQLTLKILKIDRRAKDMDLMKVFNGGSFKKAKEHNLIIKEVSNRKQILENEALKLLLNENDLRTDRTKLFINKLHENMSIASYAVIYGKRLSTSNLSKKEERLKNSKLMILDIKRNVELLKIGSKEIITALTEAGIIDSQSLVDIQDRLYTALKEEQIILTPPPPTFPLRILGHSVLSEGTVSELNDMYNEFSSFTHSTWESNTVWPFTSVLEIMTFTENLKRFTQSLDEAINDFIDFFKSMIDVFLI